MELSKLINYISAIQVAGEVERKDISNICYDSRKVKKGSMFVAIKGMTTDGHRFIPQAISAGAAAVVLEDDTQMPPQIFTHANVTKIYVQDARKALAQASHYFYKEPTSKLRAIACTGTNGKTTTTMCIESLLTSLGNTCGLVGTIANHIGNQVVPSALTTPESVDLNELLMQMVNSGCNYAIMEASSHSLALKRVFGLKFRTALFTNLTQDHLDFHGTFDKYVEAKKILFDNLDDDAAAIVNSDDELAARMTASTHARILKYGTSSDADFRISDISFDLSGTRFTLHYEGRSYSVSTKLVGIFNAYNLTAAIAAVHVNGYTIDEIISNVSGIPQVPGRFETVTRGGKIVIVDYAHTPDSLEKTLHNIRAIVHNSRQVVTVFGCGGNRDAGKRPIMGGIASELSDVVYVTNDNPRHEQPSDIIADIVKGIRQSNFRVVEDRESAIQQAITEAAEGAVILIAGKGHENYQIFGDTRIHFSDMEIGLKYLPQEIVI